MVIRRPRVNELEELRRLHEPFQDEFQFPDFDLLHSIYVVEHNGVIVAFAALREITEAILILNQEQDKELRCRALDMLQERAEMECSEIHGFVQDQKFYNLLKNRFGYQDTKGKALVKVVKKDG